MTDRILQEDSVEKAYEVSFLTETEDNAEALKRLFGQHGASITQESPVKKVNLAYPIEKRTQAVLSALKVNAAPEKIKLLEKDLRGNKNVLRSLIVAVPREKSSDEREAKKPAAPSRRAGPTHRESRIEKTKPLSNEAIEKKIEEILQ